MVAIGRESPRLPWPVHICPGFYCHVPLAKAPVTRRVSDLRITPERRVMVTPLIAPPAALTQKEPNKKPSEHRVQCGQHHTPSRSHDNAVSGSCGAAEAGAGEQIRAAAATRARNRPRSRSLTRHH